MAMDNSTWIDVSYVQKVLRNADEDNSIEVSELKVKPAATKGDHYGSDMYRVTVTFSRTKNGQSIQENKSIIVKIVPTDDLRKELIEEMSLFDTEFSMMSVTLPEMNKFLAELQQNSLSARCFYIQHESPTHLVIEDLAPAGFRLVDRQAGLDLDHSLLAIRNLGRFHASSIALKEKDPKAWSKYEIGMFHKNQSAPLVHFFNNGVKSLAAEAAKWPEISPRIIEKLRKLFGVMYEKGCETALYQEDDFNVLNHGDFWMNNMLFRYDEQGKPIDHIFVDFQIAHYGSPANDILYFLGTSAADDVRSHHRETILSEYHNSLVNTMERLKCKTAALTFEQLQEILKKRAFCEVIFTISSLPNVLREKETVLDLDKMLKPGEFVNLNYSGKIYRKVMTRLLPFYDNLGLLDL